jgi:hypothetical protein
MRFPFFSRLLLVLGFVAAQTVALAHATGHELKPETSTSCEVCALAHAGGGTPAKLDMAVIDVPRCTLYATPLLAAAPLRITARPNSRGPPTILA